MLLIRFLFLLAPLTTFCGFASAQNKPTSDVTPYEKYVTGLTAVDRVEILAVGGLPRDERKNVDCSRADIICNGPPVKIVASKTLTDAEANRISSLWRKLRRGNGAGCFAPAYVLRFYYKNELLLTTDVCFHCCNITLPGEGGDGIASICGNEAAYAEFKDFVTAKLPYPRQDKKP